MYVVCSSVLRHHTKHVTPTLNWGHAMAQVVSRQPVTAQGLVQSLASPFVVEDGQVALGQVFFE